MGKRHEALVLGALMLASSSAIAGGDAIRGQQVYEARCGGCHSVDSDRVGPRHAGVFGRRAGAVAGFAYSPALAASKLVWNAATLERWLNNPEALVPGQRMGYSLTDPALRADVVAYLATLKAAP
ncbi:MAG: c-type cytochrome [Burkholderiales bacterium]